MADEVSTVANLATAQAMYEAGHSTRQVAKALHISPASAWRLKQQGNIDPALVGHVSKQLSDRMTLASSAAVDVLLDKAIDGSLKKAKPVDLAKIGSILAQSASAYANLSGGRDMMGTLFAEFNIQPSHSASRMTVEQKITVENNPIPPVIEVNPKHNPD